MRAIALAAALVTTGSLGLPGVSSAGAARGAGVRTWYASAAASGAAANGSRRAPWPSLSAAEGASRAGDRIVVLPSSRPLDGGIALKPRQTLIGAGASVAGSTRKLAPQVANTHQDLHHGDAVVLASGATVKNLVLGPAYRGAIYGSDVTGVTIAGNDVSRQNTSCTVGFVVLPFVLPTMIPALGIPITGGLPNGWAGIMLDERHAAGSVSIRNNAVHDAACGDGIDLRLMGTARIHARIAGNLVTRLRQGTSFLSLLAIGMQTNDHSVLRAELDHNTQTDIGSILGVPTDLGAGTPGLGADSEGLFANLAGSSRLSAAVDHNTFHHGIGGFSVNGMEMVITSGNPNAAMRITDSSFTDGPGDLLEAINFGTNATMSLDLQHVIAAHTSGLGNTYVLPGNNGDCLVTGQTGAGDSTSLRIRDTRLTDCVNNGLTLASGVSNGSRGAARSLSFDIDHSQITGNHGYNLRVATETALLSLSGKVQDTNLAGAGLIDVAVDEVAGTTARAKLDFGGGALGSSGNNCITGGGLLSAEALGYDVAMRNDWWGRQGGPLLGGTLALGGGLDTSSPLGASPAQTC